MRPEEKKAFAAAIFNDETAFEKAILDIRNEADRKEVLGILAGEIINGSLKGQLNFAYLKSYENLRTNEIVKVLIQRLGSEAATYLADKLQYTPTMAAETIRHTENLLFLKRISLFYYKRYGTLFFEKVADTLFEKIALLPGHENPPRVLQDAVEGTSKHVSLVGGNAVSFKHVWEHARKASSNRKKEMSKVQLALSSILNIMENETELDHEKKRKLQERYLLNRENLDAIRNRPLDEFDPVIKRMKHVAVQTLQNR